MVVWVLVEIGVLLMVLMLLNDLLEMVVGDLGDMLGFF